MIRCIAAIDGKRGLATEQGIPWDLPTDRKFFVSETEKGLILMGLRTYHEFDEPMHGRTNYVATSSQEPLKPGFVAVPDAATFLTEHRNELVNNIGGAVLFTTTLALADELLLTKLQADFHCTKFFPEYEHLFELAKHSEPITENGVTYPLKPGAAKINSRFSRGMRAISLTVCAQAR